MVAAGHIVAARTHVSADHIQDVPSLVVREDLVVDQRLVADFSGTFDGHILEPYLIVLAHV